MKKVIVNSLIILTIVGLIAAELTLSYFLFLVFIFCPIQSCWPQKIVFLLLFVIIILFAQWLLENRKKWL